jgi:membrane-bound lytic murein transglycosylase D
LLSKRKRLNYDALHYTTRRMLMNRMKLPSLAVVILALTGCATTSHENHSIATLMDHDVGSVSKSLASQIMAEPYHGNAKVKARVEGEIDRRVWWWMRFYSVRERELFKRTLDRGENYRPMVEQILDEKKLPKELYFLAAIESGFVNHATSSTRAVGIWQFMRPTALNYGLVLNGSVDERQHPIAATEAAARYLSDLHDRFDSWYLAIAAFNAGPGRVNKAIREGHTRDFWQLVDGGFLPQETMDYIPKFLAAASIGSNLKHFGFEAATHSHPWPEIAAIPLRSGMSVKKIATLAGLTPADVLRFNPRLPGFLAHSSPHQAIRIWLPKTAASEFLKQARTVVAEAK